MPSNDWAYETRCPGLLLGFGQGDVAARHRINRHIDPNLNTANAAAASTGQSLTYETASYTTN